MCHIKIKPVSIAILSNSVDPDEMQHIAVKKWSPESEHTHRQNSGAKAYLGLLCLPMSDAFRVRKCMILKSSLNPFNCLMDQTILNIKRTELSMKWLMLQDDG